MPEDTQTEAGAQRLFPFILRTRKLLVGRERLIRSKRVLQWVLVSEDISPGSKQEILREFRDYPIVQRYTSAEFEKFFSIRGGKVVGFAKSPLAKSIYSGLKQHRLNKPEPKPRQGPEQEQAQAGDEKS